MTCLFVFVELLHGKDRIHQRHNAIDHVFTCNGVFDKKGLRNRSGVGKPGRFDNNPVKIQFPAFSLVCKSTQSRYKIGTDRAANTAVTHLDNLFGIVLNKKIAVDIFFTEFIFDDGNTLLVIVIFEDTV